MGREQYSWKIVLLSVKLDEYVPAFQVVQNSWLSNPGCRHIGGSVVVNSHVWRSAIVDVEQLLQNEVMNIIVLA